MAMQENGLDAAITGFATTYDFLSLHSADPGVGGANETSAGRVAAAWSVASAGAVTSTSKAFTGGAGSGACTHVGYWDASSSGNFGGSRALTGDQAFNAAGEYTVDSVTETATSA